jgi:K+-transporting ATPase ATPase F chain
VLTFIYIASGLCAVGLFAYLGYALIRAEKFWESAMYDLMFIGLSLVFCCDCHGHCRHGQDLNGATTC